MRVIGPRPVVAVSGTPDDRIVAIAAAQRNCMHRHQLLAAGIPAGAIYRRLHGGILLPAHRGVYTLGDTSEIPWAAETAALLSVRDGAVLSHRAAATLWGLEPRTRVVDLLILGGPSGRRSGVRIHRTRELKQHDVRNRNGLPVTSPARTLIDRAPALTDRELERAVEQAIVHGLVREPQLTARVAEAGPRARRLRELLDGQRGPTITRSEAEERFLALARDAQLPKPLVNTRHYGYELDFFWPDHALVVEIDGYAFHHSRAAFDRDRKRDARLSAAGLTVIRFTYRQLVDEPLAVAALLGAALAGPGRPAAGQL